MHVPHQLRHRCRRAQLQSRHSGIQVPSPVRWFSQFRCLSVGLSCKSNRCTAAMDRFDGSSQGGSRAVRIMLQRLQPPPRLPKVGAKRPTVVKARARRMPRGRGLPRGRAKRAPKRQQAMKMEMKSLKLLLKACATSTIFCHTLHMNTNFRHSSQACGSCPVAELV